MRRQHATKTRNSAPTLCCLKNSLGFQEAVKNNGRFTLNCGKRDFWFKPWIFVEYDYIRLKKQPVIRPSFPYHSMRRQQSPTRDYTNLRRVCKWTFEMANHAVQTSAIRWRLETLLLEKSLGWDSGRGWTKTDASNWIVAKVWNSYRGFLLSTHPAKGSSEKTYSDSFI